ncbi:MULTISPECIES: VOC family protein [Streptomyces]|uniref:VOC family protein n=1 Tax=Streptomyces TaxID=1883 RepID=UPI001963623F|nr:MULTISPECIES: VOC family protein [Streptomyces]QRX95667.1 VOC family protein [Streptomyces noursei]UJB45492.1 VOC family protein [Streptomyces sp. A1-5]
MTGFYHVCFVVPDIEQAMRDFQRSAGVEWSAPVSDRMGEWDYRIAFSTGGPPFIELITGPTGSPWDASQGARFDHMGFWSSDVGQGSPRLEKEGMPVDFSGCPYGRPFAYHRMDSIGARIELVDVSRQTAFLDKWHPGGEAMPVIDENSRG